MTAAHASARCTALRSPAAAKLGVKLGLGLGFGLGVLLTYAPHAAAQDVERAFVWADKPTAATYEAAGAYAQASGPVTITRSGPGKYEVALGALAQGAEQAMIVTPYGGEARTCSLMRWSGGSAHVACADLNDAPADTQFSLLAAKADPDAKPRNVAYAWANSPAADRYAPDARYAYNGGDPIEVRRAGPGAYRVAFGEILRGPGANVQVSTYGDPRVQCQVRSWGAGAASVACTDTDGEPADTRFTILAARVSGTPDTVGYVWANHAARPSEYMPSLAYQYAPGATATVTRRAQGVYAVSIGPIARASGGNAQVVAYGAGRDTSCQMASWGGGTLNVRCFSRATGAPKDSQFSALFVR